MEGRDAAKSRDLILDAAEGLFATRGYRGTSIAAVCKVSGLPTGSVYWHFGNKAGVALAVMQRGARAFFARMPRAADLEGGPAERLCQFFEAAAKAIAANSAFFRLEPAFQLESHEEEAIRMVLREVTDYTVREIVSVVEPAARDSGVPDPAGLAIELADLTMVLTRGSLLQGDIEGAERAMRRVHHLILLSIADAAEGARRAG
ncbi:TetR/AcrR family transcriptional regulator [Streptomyces sp. NPDC002588]|uniref:TetR/AcrR family transcriptional regulator n=1 Tax=Streptomyces sp. NPDC002588 TaxID=3154419 RepID=UPI00332BC220